MRRSGSNPSSWRSSSVILRKIFMWRLDSSSHSPNASVVFASLRVSASSHSELCSAISRSSLLFAFMSPFLVLAIPCEGQHPCPRADQVLFDGMHGEARRLGGLLVAHAVALAQQQNG